MEALREENGAIKAQLNGQRNDWEKAKSLEKSREEEISVQKSHKNKVQSSRETFERTKEPTKNANNEVSNTASSCIRAKKKDLFQGKRSTKY